jgi:hypothetical protein
MTTMVHHHHHLQQKRNLANRFVLFLFLVCCLNCCQSFHIAGIRIIISQQRRRQQRKKIHNSRTTTLLPSTSVSISKQRQPPKMKNLDGLELERETVTVTVIDSSESNFDLDRWQAGGDGIITSFSQTCFNEYWSTLPSIIISSNNNVVNPYSFSHRMAIGKYLTENTNTGGEKIWGNNNNHNFLHGYSSKHWLWGYLAQMDWQHRSGRFHNPLKWTQDNITNNNDSNNNNNENKISKLSWWGYMNLNFSIAVYCGAAEAGLVPKITLLDSDNDNDTLLKDDIGYLECVQLWKDFWMNDHAAFILNSSKNSNKVKKNKNDDDDDEEQSMLVLYKALWKTHTEIIKISLQYSKELQDVLPKEDRSVGLGWCNMVELLSATNWPLLSLDSLCKFGCGYLPTKRLGPDGQQTVKWMEINRPMEYTTINSLYQLMDTSETVMNTACTFFARVSRWKAARNNLPRTLHILTHGNLIQKCLSLSRVIILAILPKYRASSSLLEALGITSILAAFAICNIGKTKKLILN